MKPYLLTKTRLRMRGVNDQAFKDLLRSWRDLGGDVQIGPAGAMDMIGYTSTHFWKLAEKISGDSRLFPVAEEIMTLLEGSEAKTWDMALPGGGALKIGHKPVIMGILNVTPDSFSDGGKHFTVDAALDSAIEMISEGADIIDVGGESTRPGAPPVSVDDEIGRVAPVICELAQSVKIPISIDTRKSGVARAAIENGATIVNDISMLTHDPAIADVAGAYRVPLILSHIQGTPENMQVNPRYDDLWPDVIDALNEAVREAKRRGVPEESIILDPGIGFGKKFEHNLELIDDLDALTSLGKPILVGPSRKRFIGDITKTEPKDRVEGTIAACVLAMTRGASLFRVHDVKANRRALDVAWAISRKGDQRRPR